MAAGKVRPPDIALAQGGGAEKIMWRNLMKAVLSMAAVAVVCALFTTAAWAQDPAQTDPVHFKVELDNPSVRVLHVKVEPNTKVKLHDMADAVVVPLADYDSILKRKNGETTKVERKRGKAVWLS